LPIVRFAGVAPESGVTGCHSPASRTSRPYPAWPGCRSPASRTSRLYPAWPVAVRPRRGHRACIRHIRLSVARVANIAPVSGV